jgi:hypothetical protein
LEKAAKPIRAGITPANEFGTSSDETVERDPGTCHTEDLGPKGEVLEFLSGQGELLFPRRLAVETVAKPGYKMTAQWQDVARVSEPSHYGVKFRKGDNADGDNDHYVAGPS